MPSLHNAADHLQRAQDLVLGGFKDDHPILSFGKFVKFDYAKPASARATAGVNAAGRL